MDSSDHSLPDKKPTLAVLTSRFPYPLEKGDKLRLFHQIKGLSSYFEIILISIGEGDIRKIDFEKVTPFTKQIHFFRLNTFTRVLNLCKNLFQKIPFQVSWFFDPNVAQQIHTIIRREDIDFVYCQLARMAPYCSDINKPVVLDYMDAFGIGMERRAGLVNGVMKRIYLLESRRMKQYEKHLSHRFSAYTIISEQDKRCFDTGSSGAKLSVIPNGIDDSFFENKKNDKRYDLVFVGNMGYLPNIEAAEFLVNKLLPKLAATVTVLIAGARPHQRVLSLKSENVMVGGWYEDIRDAYGSARIFVAPLWSGTGQQNKILEAMAQGLPCITTPAVNNAIGGQDGENILIANDVSSFIERINYLLSNNEAVLNIGGNSKSFVKQNFSWKESNDQLRQIIVSSQIKK